MLPTPPMPTLSPAHSWWMTLPLGENGQGSFSWKK